MRSLRVAAFAASLISASSAATAMSMSGPLVVTVTGDCAGSGAGSAAATVNVTCGPGFGSVGGLTAGSIPYAGSDGKLAQDNANWFWDRTNKRLGIGTSSPTDPFSATHAQGLFILNALTGANDAAEVVLTNDAAEYLGLWHYSGAGGYTALETNAAGGLIVGAEAGPLILWSNYGAASAAVTPNTKTGTISAQSPVFSNNSIFAAPASVGNWTSVTTAFNGDLSRTNLVIGHQIYGAGTLGQPSDGSYRWTEEAYPIVGHLYNESGHQQNVDGTGGRTGLAFIRLHLDHNGLGDGYIYNGTVRVSGVKAGATTFQANGAGGILNGECVGGHASVYCDPDEMNIEDGGFGIAAAGIVRNFYRTSSATPIGDETWWGARFQSLPVGVGPALPVDVMVSGIGPWKFGVDLAGIDTSSNSNSVISTRTGQRWYGNVTAGLTAGGLYRFPTAMGSAHFGYESGAWTLTGGFSVDNVTNLGSLVETAIETDTSSATWTVTNRTVVCNKATAMTETAPSSGWALGQAVRISNIGAGVCTADSGSAHKIGVPGAQTKALNQGDTLTMWCQAVSSGACTQFVID
jgi:hypothetical protein